MSRVGKMPVVIPQGVEVAVAAVGNVNKVTVKGPKGTITKEFEGIIALEKKAGEIILTRPNDEKKNKALHGCYRALLQNMVVGVSTGFSKQLTWEGVGYRMAVKGKGLTLQMGFSHDVDIAEIPGITFKLGENNTLIIEGMDKELVGQVAANIRGVKGPEPYKGKGIRYSDEVIARKAGKAAK